MSEQHEETGPTEFELGLVMAGAVSAGAYTAGVIDFLIQALDAWYRAKDAHEAVPPHAVKLKVMSGSSAGGMTAAIATAALRAEFPPVVSLSEVSPANKLFDSWVSRIDISSLLETRDLAAPGASLRSLLDSSVLEAIASRALEAPKRGARRPYVDDALHVILTVANLRGMPYNIPFEGERTDGHAMVLHADHLHFALSDPAHRVAGALALDWEGAAPAWRVLETAALATGAFPVGLAPRGLSHELSSALENVYARREWPFAMASPEDAPYQTIPPYLPGAPYPYVYDFLCVDGGLLDNEPLELARRYLAGRDGRNPREADRARRALIMIDPFPGGEAFQRDYQARHELTSVVPGVFSALLNQARFKPDELALAQRPDVFSRFLIAPKRTPAAGPDRNLHLASALLGGFGGFLSRSFREHDFMLGRRNCQRFLETQLILSENNPLFSRWSPEERARRAIQKGGKVFFPVIPLVGAARDEVPPREWPRYETQRLPLLRAALERRYDAVARALVGQWFSGWPTLPLVRLAARGVRKRIVVAAMGRIEADLDRYALLARG